MNRMKPIVSILMGSDSDMYIMQSAADTLKKFNVAYEIIITSAHRSPQQTMYFAKQAEKRGIKIIIAGASGAAHLPGVVASWCTLPVIGVPIKNNTLHGVDSFISMTEMPRGVPVATVGINNATNAALFAIAILAIKDNTLRKKLSKYREELVKQVKAKNNICS